MPRGNLEINKTSVIEKIMPSGWNIMDQGKNSA
jgi:hypothetical protein